nr:Gfo/Idh/MocA family oxidoreductase [Streptomyces sp. S1D4-11]QIZ01175.1 Gfo/Idh/MocA family oxidoreductase [Streptomyces sp. S1D4-11]
MLKNWARHGHLPVLGLLDAYEVVAVQSRRRQAAEETAGQFGVRHVTNTVKELAEHPEVDLVVVATTAPQHEEGIRAAAAAGKHVYSEWPLTTSAEKAEELAALVRTAGVRHVVGLQRRLAPHNAYLHQLLAEGYVGAVRSVRMHVSVDYFYRTLPQALRWTVAPENFSSVIAIYAGHFLDMLFHAVGRPTSATGLMVNQFDPITIEETGEQLRTSNPDQLVVAGTLADRAVVSVHVEGGKRSGSGVQLDITGDAGDLRITNTSAFGGIGDDYVVTGAQGTGGRLQPLVVPREFHPVPMPGLPSSVAELAGLYAAFAQDVTEGTRTAPAFDDAVWLHRFLQALRHSSQSGERVSASRA